MNPYARPPPSSTTSNSVHGPHEGNRQHRGNGERNYSNHWPNNQANHGPSNRYPQSRQGNFQSRQQNNITSHQYNSDSHNNFSHQNNFSQAPPNNPSNTNQYSVLYTHQKLKKKKQWKDGRLTLPPHGGRATLYDANPAAGSGGAPIDSVEISAVERNSIALGGELESEKYLIQIEGPWLPTSNNSALSNPVNSALTSLTNTNKPIVSSGMKKLMSRKFVVPPQKLPNFAEQRRQKMERDGKRKRVLQPGELERRHGGGGWNGQSNGYQGGGYGNGWQAGNGDGYNNNGYGGQGNRFQDGNYSGQHQHCNSGGNSFQGNQSNNSSLSGGGFEHERNRFRDTNDPNSSGNNSNIARPSQFGWQGDGGYNTNQGSDHSESRYNGGDNNRGYNFGQNNSNGNNDRNFSSHLSYRENSKFRDVNANTGSSNGPMAFGSNGLDASGFYGEEEEEEDDHIAGGYWNGNENNGQQQIIRNWTDERSEDLNSCNGFAGVPVGSKGYDQTNSFGDARDCPSNELIARPNETRDNKHKPDQCASQTQSLSSQISNEGDRHVNDELFALLGVPTSGRQETCASNRGQESFVGNHSVRDARSHGDNDHSKSHSTQNNEDSANPPRGTGNSFLAGLIEAEDSLENDKPLSGWNSLGYDFDSQQYDDTKDGDGDSYDDTAYDLDDRDIPKENEKNQTVDSPKDVSRDTEPTMSHITALTLPSASGGSSSEDDEDSAFDE